LNLDPDAVGAPYRGELGYRARQTLAPVAAVHNDPLPTPPLVPSPPVRAVFVPVVAACAVFAGCGGSGSSTTPKVNPDYADFCLEARSLDDQSKATHGNDPTAMSDPATMKQAWTTIIEASRLLVEHAPLAVKGDVKTMYDGMLAMDKIYASYSYNLGEMKAVPKVAEDLNTIANDATVAAASQRFKKFMSDNCGF
jgi:hypothetical protein